jgi:hypothetical protein
MGVLNVTPDSFSDGGRYVDPDDAIEHGLAMLRAGADLIDVGGESTRPRSLPIDPVEEQRRVLPIVAALAAHGRVSIDTRNASTAEAAIEAGATLVNDVSAALWPVAAANGAGWVAMHMLGDPTTMQEHPTYDDVVVATTSTCSPTSTGSSPPASRSASGSRARASSVGWSPPPTPNTTSPPCRASPPRTRPITHPPLPPTTASRAPSPRRRGPSSGELA